MTKWNFFPPLTCLVEKLLSHWNSWLDFRLLKLVSLSGSGSANLSSGLSSGNYFCSIPPPPTTGDRTIEAIWFSVVYVIFALPVYALISFMHLWNSLCYSLFFHTLTLFYWLMKRQTLVHHSDPIWRMTIRPFLICFEATTSPITFSVYSWIGHLQARAPLLVPKNPISASWSKVSGVNASRILGDTFGYTMYTWVYIWTADHRWQPCHQQLRKLEFCGSLRGLDWPPHPWSVEMAQKWKHTSCFWSG